MGTKSIILEYGRRYSTMLDDARAVVMIDHSIRVPQFHRSFDHDRAHHYRRLNGESSSFLLVYSNKTGMSMASIGYGAVWELE